MFRKMLIGAATLVAVAAFTVDGASARGPGGGHGGGGFHGAAIGGGNAFRSAAVSGGAFRGAAVNPGIARFAAPAAGARFAGGNPGWHHRNGWRGVGGGLALGFAAAPYYNSYTSYPYDDSYYDNGYYSDGYYSGDDTYAVPDDSSSCYVARRVHTRHGWRIRRVFVCG